jgi:hypothetical protein
MKISRWMKNVTLGGPSFPFYRHHLPPTIFLSGYLAHFFGPLHLSSSFHVLRRVLECESEVREQGPPGTPLAKELRLDMLTAWCVVVFSPFPSPGRLQEAAAWYSLGEGAQAGYAGRLARAFSMHDTSGQAVGPGRLVFHGAGVSPW